MEHLPIVVTGCSVDCFDVTEVSFVDDRSVGFSEMYKFVVIWEEVVGKDSDIIFVGSSDVLEIPTSDVVSINECLINVDSTVVSNLVVMKGCLFVDSLSLEVESVIVEKVIDSGIVVLFGIFIGVSGEDFENLEEEYKIVVFEGENVSILEGA